MAGVGGGGGERGGGDGEGGGGGDGGGRGGIGRNKSRFFNTTHRAEAWLAEAPRRGAGFGGGYPPPEQIDGIRNTSHPTQHSGCSASGSAN